MRGSGLPVIATLRDTVWSNRYAHIPNDPHFTLVAAKGALPANIVCSNESFQPGGPPVPSVPFDTLANPVVGLRLHGEQLCHIVHQRLCLRWLDASGTERTAEVVPAVMPGVFTVTFPMTGIVSNVRLEPATWSVGLVVSTAEWLVENRKATP